MSAKSELNRSILCRRLFSFYFWLDDLYFWLACSSMTSWVLSVNFSVLHEALYSAEIKREADKRAKFLGYTCLENMEILIFLSKLATMQCKHFSWKNYPEKKRKKMDTIFHKYNFPQAIFKTILAALSFAAKKSLNFELFWRFSFSSWQKKNF